MPRLSLSTLKTQIIGDIWANDGAPVAYEETGVRDSRTIGTHRVIYQGGLQKAVGRVKIVKVEAGAQMIRLVQLIVEFAKCEILNRIARIGPGERLEVSVGRAA